MTTIESPEAGTPLVARIYRVDMSALEVPTDRTYASSAAILRLIADVGGSPQGPAIANRCSGAWCSRTRIRPGLAQWQTFGRWPPAEASTPRNGSHPGRGPGRSPIREPTREERQDRQP